MGIWRGIVDSTPHRSKLTMKRKGERAVGERESNVQRDLYHVERDLHHVQRDLCSKTDLHYAPQKARICVSLSLSLPLSLSLSLSFSLSLSLSIHTYIYILRTAEDGDLRQYIYLYIYTYIHTYTHIYYGPQKTRI